MLDTNQEDIYAFYFTINYLKKIYELSLDEIYGEYEDTQIEKEHFDTFFKEEIMPALLTVGGQLTPDGLGVIYNKKTYYNYSDVTSKNLEVLNYEQTIRRLYSIPEGKCIEEQPNTITYSDNLSSNTSFYGTINNILQDKQQSYIHENEITR